MSAGVYVHCDAAGIDRAAAPVETRNLNWVLITTILTSGLTREFGVQRRSPSDWRNLQR